MPIDLQITLGQVNYTNYIHVTACKVASPTVVAWEDWIPGPLPTNYVFIIPNLDPDNYYISFYDSPDNVSLGTLIAQAYVKATNPEFAYELRFYLIGSLPSGVTLDGTRRILNDPYLVNKTIESYFKESFRFLEPTVDVTFDNTTGDVQLMTGSDFEDGEKFTITLKYAVGTVSASGNGFYKGTINISDSVYSMLPADRNKRARLVGTASTQVITMCSLSQLTIDDGYYFDNCCGGTAIQVKLLMDGYDRVKFNGFMAASDEFDEFWISKGEHLLIRKLDDNYFEILLDYKGVQVGLRTSAGYVGMPGWHAEDGALTDGDEYSRVWWWINTLLPSSHIITDDALTGGGYVHPAGKEGLFVKHSTLKKFRWPNTQNLSERGLKDFNAYGSDSERIYDYPGGKQNEMLLAHGHKVATTGNQSGVDPGRAIQRASTNPDPYQVGAGTNPYIETVGGAEQRVKNIGVIYMRHL